MIELRFRKHTWCASETKLLKLKVCQVLQTLPRYVDTLPVDTKLAPGRRGRGGGDQHGDILIATLCNFVMLRVDTFSFRNMQVKMSKSFRNTEAFGACRSFRCIPSFRTINNYKFPKHGFRTVATETETLLTLSFMARRCRICDGPPCSPSPRLLRTAAGLFGSPRDEAEGSFPMASNLIASGY